MRARAAAATGGAVIALLAAAAPAGAVHTRVSGAADTKSWCAAVIDANTKAGTMRNKRFLSINQVPLSAWKKVVDEAATHGEKYIALAPSQIKTAVTHQVAYFRHIKANNYSKTTPLAPLTLADIKQITNFEKTKCGIRFS